MTHEPERPRTLDGVVPLRAVYTLELHETPPSLNKLLYRHWREQHRIKRNWQRMWEGLLLLRQVPRIRAIGKTRRIHAYARLTFPVERRRDEDNYKAVISKTLADALVNGGWLEDDTPEFFSFGGVEFTSPGPHRTEIILEVFG